MTTPDHPFDTAFNTQFGSAIVPILPIFQNWTISHINTQRIGVAFTVNISFQLPGGAANLTFTDDKGSPQVASPVVTTRATTVSFQHPAPTKVGMHTVTLFASGDPSNSVTSNAFQVVRQ